MKPSPLRRWLPILTWLPDYRRSYLKDDAAGTVEFAKWSAALALAAGAVYLALGVLRLGWVPNFLSKAVLAGFILGYALRIVIDQTYKLLGVASTEGSYLQELIGTIGKIGDTDLTTLAVGLGSLAVLLPLRHLRPRWPRVLLVVVLATAATSVLDLADHGVAVTGSVPTGLFSIGMPGIGWSEVSSLMLGALAIVFVGFSETLAAGRTTARRHGYEIDPDQELVAQGAASGAAGFVGGFVNDGSLSKTSVADTAGQRNQMASLINGGLRRRRVRPHRPPDHAGQGGNPRRRRGPGRRPDRGPRHRAEP